MLALAAWLESKHASEIFQGQLIEARTQTGSVALQLDEIRKQSQAALAQLEEARKQSKAAQDQTQLARNTQRPWIAVEEMPAAVCPVKPTAYGCAMKLSVTLRNIGPTPAFSVIAYAAGWVSKIDRMNEVENAVAVQTQVCSHVERGEQWLTFAEATPAENGRTLFPNQADKRELQIPHYTFAAPGSGAKVVVLGCVQYSFDESPHVTNFAFEVREAPDGSGLNLTPLAVPQLWVAN
ncbi:hypothetical protein ACQR03_06710 [Bradyrhizobium sp. HKCCYLS3070]|uniref:hypothetical protein n=1 Tax=Bradyrhizobium oligotrophicum TaxID=44255 RepID=UPI003EBAF693